MPTDCATYVCPLDPDAMRAGPRRVCCTSFSQQARRCMCSRSRASVSRRCVLGWDGVMGGFILFENGSPDHVVPNVCGL